MPRYLFVLFITISFATNSYCQGTPVGPDGKPMSVDLTEACSDPAAIFLVVEKPSEFKEGRKALLLRSMRR